nr:hypothetical protein [uncultured Selenomonas sp.]
MKRLFVVNDLERLKEYGFNNPGRWGGTERDVFEKDLGEIQWFGSMALLRMVVNPRKGEMENQLVLCCEACDGDETAADGELTWDFDELMQMLHDGVIEWVESTPS